MHKDILNLLRAKDYIPSRSPELLSHLGLPATKSRELDRTLRDLERLGQVARIKGHRYIIPTEADLVPGRIQITRQGRGFLLPDDPGLGEIAIRATDTGTALPDDRVLVRRDVRPKGMRRQEAPADSGSVVRVLERKRTRFVGTLMRSRQSLHVVPDDPRIAHDIQVPPPKDVGRQARAGDKVVVELKSWESPQLNPEGEIVEVLGPPSKEGVDMLSVLRQYDLPLSFPRSVLQEARKIGTEVSTSDLKDRTDCRQHTVITIDPEDAKDFDDAFSLQQAGANRWKLWVHIADVSHYVRPGTALDQEARRRGNSTYLVDRVIPMLPEALSNELCSLKPNVDRLTKCVEFLLENDGTVVRSRCYPAVIHSRRRFTYEEALAVLNGSPNGKLEKMLVQAGKLAQKIRRKRFRAGSLNLDFPETKIRLDERGHVSTIEKLENDESHQLIEEFMLLANEAVAGRLLRMKRPTLHRVHETPNPDRLRDYREEVLSHNVPCGNLENPNEVRKLLRRLSDLSIGPALKIGFLKSLMRARYAVESLGHYGLAKKQYTHFTSPIRRYADLVVHRSLFEDGQRSQMALRDVADHISATERNSSDAERDSKQVKLQAFLASQMKSGKRQSYEALVTDVRNFGFFVDVPALGMSGLVPLSILEDDFYEFDSTRALVRGRRSRRTIRLGDRITVEVAKVDARKKLVDFRLPAPEEEPGGRKKDRRGRLSRGGRSTPGQAKKAKRTGAPKQQRSRKDSEPSKPSEAKRSRRRRRRRRG